MFSTPEVQRLVSGDNAEIDLDDLKYVTLVSSLWRPKFFYFTCCIISAVYFVNVSTERSRFLQDVCIIVLLSFTGNTPSTMEVFTAAIVSSSGCGISCPVTSVLRRGLCSSRLSVVCL